ncbi:hypothetical protein ABPG72_000291 [Tetrahymena utriculariae]
MATKLPMKQLVKLDTGDSLDKRTLKSQNTGGQENHRLKENNFSQITANNNPSPSNNSPLPLNNQDIRINIYDLEKKMNQDKKASEDPQLEQANIEQGQPETTSLFSSDDTRRAFIRKVLGIICVQLVITTIFILVGVFSPTYQEFQQRNKWLTVFCVLLNIALLFALYCFRDYCRQVPKNYILLFLFTFSESFLISYLCGVTNPTVVLLAGALTTIIVFALSIYACLSKTDVTMKTSLLIYFPLAVIVILIVAGSYQSYMSQVIVSLAIIGLFSLYLVFDLQRLSGKKSITYTMDDYIIAALDIYIDIIIMFKELIYLLSR